MKTFISIITLLIFNISLSAQNFTLANKSFVNSFKTETFSLKKLNPKATSYWQLIAGRFTDIRVDDSDEVFRKIIDSVKCEFIHEGALSLYKDSMELLRKLLVYYECMVTHNQCSSKLNFCDSLNPTDFEMTSVNISNLGKIFDASVWQEGYNREYKIEYIYASSPKFSKPAPILNYCITTGWGTWCPPGFCDWFIESYKYGKAEKINDYVKLKEFLGKIDNINKAYLLVCASDFGDSHSYPVDGNKLKFTKVGTTFFLIENLRLSDCPVRVYTCLISVKINGEVKIIDKTQIGKEGGCI